MSCSRAKNMGTTETKAEQEDAFLLSHLTSSPCRAEDKKMCDFLHVHMHTHISILVLKNNEHFSFK